MSATTRFTEPSVAKPGDVLGLLLLDQFKSPAGDEFAHRYTDDFRRVLKQAGLHRLLDLASDLIW